MQNVGVFVDLIWHGWMTPLNEFSGYLDGGDTSLRPEMRSNAPIQFCHTIVIKDELWTLFLTSSLNKPQMLSGSP